MRGHEIEAQGTPHLNLLSLRALYPAAGREGGSQHSEHRLHVCARLGFSLLPLILTATL